MNCYSEFSEEGHIFTLAFVVLFHNGFKHIMRKIIRSGRARCFWNDCSQINLQKLFFAVIKSHGGCCHLSNDWWMGSLSLLFSMFKVVSSGPQSLILCLK